MKTMRDGELGAARFSVEPVEQGSIGIDEFTRQQWTGA